MAYPLLVLLIVLFANRLNIAACTLVVKQLRVTPQRSLQIRSVLLAVAKQLPALTATIIRSTIIIIFGLVKLIVPGVTAYADHCLFPSIVIMEGERGSRALVRSKALVRRLLGATALMYAARIGNVDTIKALLEAGADVNAKNVDGDTALISAAMRGHTETVKVLLMAGANVNAKDKNGKTALRYAVEEGHNEVVQLLRDAKAME